jgi:hypothetical protein
MMLAVLARRCSGKENEITMCTERFNKSRCCAFVEVFRDFEAKDYVETSVETDGPRQIENLNQAGPDVELRWIGGNSVDPGNIANAERLGCAEPCSNASSDVEEARNLTTGQELR